MEARSLKMRVLVIDQFAKDSIAAVIDYAKENTIDNKELQARCAVPDGFFPIGDDQNHCCSLSMAA